ncbi:MAG: response regulator [Candidatus Sericytochromatia bacterium]
MNIGYKILVVEDSTIFRKLVTNFLSDKGFLVTSVSSAIEATNLLSNEKFHLIITDMNMPEMSGFDLLIWLKKHNIKSKVIVVTATESDELREKFMDYGAVKYITKPVNFESLLDLIHSIDKKGFTSNINNIEIFDYIKIAAISKQNKLISITAPLEKEKGYMYFKNGELVHCEYKNETGFDAFYKMISLKGGSIDDEFWIEPEEISIKIPFENLILTSAKILDENKNEDTKNKEYKVLLLDDSIIVRKVIKNFLEKKGVKVTEVESAIKATKILENENFNIIFSDIERANDINSFEFLSWLKNNKVESKVVMITANTSNEFKEMVENLGALKYYNKTNNLNDIYNYIQEDTTSGFKGKISEINIFDYLQIATLSGKNRKLVISSAVSDDKGYIYIKDKKIINVEYKNYEPEDAIHKIFCMPFGVINEEELDSNVTEKIKTDSFKLFMSVIKKLEETKTKIGFSTVEDEYIEKLENKISKVEKVLGK